MKQTVSSVGDWFLNATKGNRDIFPVLVGKRSYKGKDWNYLREKIMR